MYNENTMNIEDRVNRMAVDLELLVRKAEIWQSLFDECPLGVAVFNAEMKFYLINKEFTEIAGFGREVLGEGLHTVIPKHLRRSHRKAEKDFAVHPEKKVNRHGVAPVILTKSGDELPVDIDLSYIQYDSKIYYVAFIRRISQ